MIENEVLKGFLMTTLFMLKVKLLKVKVDAFLVKVAHFLLLRSLFRDHVHFLIFPRSPTFHDQVIFLRSRF